MEAPCDSLGLFADAGLEVCDFGKKGRGVVAKQQLKCGDVLLREKGWYAKNMDKLTALLLASDEGRKAAVPLYAGPLCHLQGVSTDTADHAHAVAGDEWSDMYAKVRYNSFELDGSAMLPNIAMLNHSCQPNAAVVRIEPFTECVVVVVVVSESGIAPGQEVVLCYDSQLMFTPVQERQRQIMTGWSFICRCPRCEAELANEEESEDKQAAEEDNDFHKLLVDSSPEKLSDLALFHWRREAMHQPGLQFAVRRNMFAAQLAAACTILPCLHPALKDIYQQLEDLCSTSPYKDRCQLVCKFHEALCSGDEARWEAVLPMAP